MKAPRGRGCFLYKKPVPPVCGATCSGSAAAAGCFSTRRVVERGRQGKRMLRFHGHFGLFFYALGVDVE